MGACERFVDALTGAIKVHSAVKALLRYIKVPGVVGACERFVDALVLCLVAAAASAALHPCILYVCSLNLIQP